MSTQTKIDLSGYWYDFYLKEISKQSSIFKDYKAGRKFFGSR